MQPNSENTQRKFFGRQMECERFVLRLSQPLDAQHCLSVINLWGVEGVGRTRLLDQFALAAAQQPNTAWVDLEGQDVPSLFTWLVTDLEKLGWRFAEFKKWSANLPSQLLMRNVPELLGAGVGMFNAPAGKLMEAGGKTLLAAFDRKSLLLNEQLKRNPVQSLNVALTPALISQSQTRKLILAVDDYEERRAWLEPFLPNWLRDLSEYPQLGLTVILVTRRELQESVDWAGLPGMVSMPLRAFSLAETMQYCQQYSLSEDVDLQKALHEAAGGLPLYITTVGRPLERVPDFSEESYNKFLGQVNDSQTRWLMAQAALPRFFDLDVLAVLFGSEKAGSLFEPITQLSFTRRQDIGGRRPWIYHSSVRQQFLQYVRKASKKEWQDIHGRLADYYEQQHQQLHAQKTELAQDEYPLLAEAIYHSACQDMTGNLIQVIQWIIPTLLSKWEANPCIRALAAAEQDCQVPAQARWGEKILESLKSPEIRSMSDLMIMLETGVQLCQQLLQLDGLDRDSRARLYERQGLFYLTLSSLPKLFDGFKRMGIQTPQDRKDADPSLAGQRALEAFQQAIALDPSNLDYRAALGYQYINNGDYKKAIEEIKKTVELEPSNVERIKQLGDCYKVAGNIPNAIACYKYALKADDKVAGVHAALGEVYAEQRDFQAAIDSFSRASELEQTLPLPYYQMGVCQHAAGDLAGAIQSLSKCLEFVENGSIEQAASLFVRGMCYFQLESMQKSALDDLWQVVKFSPNFFEARTMIGMILFSLDLYEETIAEMDVVIQAKAAGYQDYLMRGEAYYFTQQYALAIHDLKKVIDLDPNTPLPYPTLGECYYHCRKYKQALGMFEHVLAAEPNDLTALFYRGKIYLELEHSEQALQDFSALLTLEPHYQAALQNRSIAYMNLGRHAQALADINTLVTLNPGDPIYLFQRGMCYFQAERHPEAIADLTVAIEQIPDCSSSYYHIRAQSYQSIGQHLKAIEDFTSAARLDLLNHLIFFRRGLSYQAVNEHERAVRDFTGAIALAEDQEEIYLARAASYAALGSKKPAEDDTAQTVSLLAKRLNISEDEVLKKLRQG